MDLASTARSAMKIRAIDTEKTDGHKLALITERPFSDEFFSEFLKLFCADASMPRCERSGGSIILTPPTTRRDIIDFVNQCLQQAEKNIAEQKSNAEAARKARFEALSKNLGLPLE